MMRKILPTVLAAVIGLAACSSGADSNDQSVTENQHQRYQSVQAVPQFDWSQYRQTVIDVESAQVHGTATTTFFFNLGTPNPIKSCPSVGFPVSTTSQLTNPEAYYGNGVTLPQEEPNGVYTGDSSGTYVVCVSKTGAKYVSYWEGDVQTEGGAAHWDRTTGSIVLDGDPTVKAKTR